MRVKRVVKQVKATKQSLEEVRRDNCEYFVALAEQIGEKAAQEAEERYLQEVAQELEAVIEGETVNVRMVQLTEDTDDR